MAQDSRAERAAAPANNDYSNRDGNSDNDRPAPAKRGSKRLRAVLISAVLITAALIFAWRWWQDQKRFVSTDDAMIEADRLAVSSRMLGRIVDLTAAEGDTVNTGDILVRLDTADLRAQQAQAQAGLGVAQANVRLARVTLERARTDFERAQSQLQNQTITQEQYDHARQDYDAAQARLQVAEAQVPTSTAQIAVIDTSLRNTAIVSPMRGVVSRRWVLEGDVVQPGQAIYTLYNLDSVWVTANLEETKLGRIAPGDSVFVHIDAYPDRDFTGRVAQLGTNTAAQFSLIPPSNASGNFTKITQRVPVRIALDESGIAGARLLPGMSATVRIKR